MERQDRPWWRSLRLFGVGAMAGAAAVSIAALGLSWRAHHPAGLDGQSMAELAPPPTLAAQVAEGRQTTAQTMAPTDSRSTSVVMILPEANVRGFWLEQPVCAG